jgi:mannose-6-phosphate isomerase-like protein (cupin superfamily)
MDTTTFEENLAAASPLTIRPSDIDTLPTLPVPGCPGVTVRQLWRSGDLHDTLITYAAGAATPGNPHNGADHHIWVVSGSAVIDGRPVEAGSYVHVPPGADHPIRATGPAGCVLLQVHRPVPGASVH